MGIQTIRGWKKSYLEQAIKWIRLNFTYRAKDSYPNYSVTFLKTILGRWPWTTWQWYQEIFVHLTLLVTQRQERSCTLLEHKERPGSWWKRCIFFGSVYPTWWCYAYVCGSDIVPVVVVIGKIYEIMNLLIYQYLELYLSIKTEYVWLGQ